MKTSVHFKKGDAVKILCYKEGCGDISIPVTLGVEYEIHPSFVRGGGVGRLHWPINARATGFELSRNFHGSGYCSCPRCNTLFGGVVVIFNGRGKKATVFGYDPSPV